MIYNICGGGCGEERKVAEDKFQKTGLGWEGRGRDTKKTHKRSDISFHPLERKKMQDGKRYINI